MTTTIRIYPTYKFRNQDPIVDEIRELIRTNKQTSIAEGCRLSRVSRTTVDNWLRRKTMRPQFATVAAFAGAYDYVVTLQKTRT